MRRSSTLVRFRGVVHAVHALILCSLCCHLPQTPHVDVQIPFTGREQLLEEFCADAAEKFEAAVEKGIASKETLKVPLSVQAPGCGKSRLLDEIGRALAARFTGAAASPPFKFEAVITLAMPLNMRADTLKGSDRLTTGDSAQDTLVWVFSNLLAFLLIPLCVRAGPLAAVRLLRASRGDDQRVP
jgi:hypothetical protein